MTDRSRIPLSVLVCGLTLGLGVPQQSAAPASPPGGALTIDRLLDIKHPGSAVWSPDGRRIAFTWDRAGVQNIWTVDAQSVTPAPQSVTSFDDGAIEELSWSRDGRSLRFVRDGDPWEVASAERSAPHAVWTTKEAESQFALSPDGTRLAFVRGGMPGVPDWQRVDGDLWVRRLADGRETRLTAGQGVVSGPTWSPDGKRLAFAIAKAETRTDAPAYSGGKILYARVDHQPSTPAYVSAAGGPITLLPPSPGWESAPWWLDASRLLMQRIADDYRTRELLVADVNTGAVHTIYREVAPTFWSLGFIAPDPAPSPDGRWIALVSDRDGWDHVYVLPSSGGEPRQIEKGTFESRHLAWSPDSTRLAFDRSLEGKPGVRHVAVATIGSDLASATVSDLSSGGGTNVAPAWSPDGTRVVYQHTDAQTSPELFVMEATGTPQPVRLTDSMPAGVDHAAFVQPESVTYSAPDGRQVPAYLFVPKHLDRSRKHPAIVWIHGDGINQNYDGWHVERNYSVYYSFHQYLLQKGYVVLAPEYRGSIGYGREWREGVYMDVGGKDAMDAAVASDYLTTLPYVDADRIGVWGLSYGGFFTLISMTERPTAYRCGVNVAGTVDYKMWFEDPGGAWIVSRMGTPAGQPSVYEKAAVIDRMHKLSRPLLILHGTADGNVPYMESVRLIDVLLKEGKDFEFRMYPGEYHYFQRAHVLRDAWQEVERFFGKHLKPGA
jgi:dipeptidyl aminopeptidase/acylaminoacyl peptidase